MKKVVCAEAACGANNLRPDGVGDTLLSQELDLKVFSATSLRELPADISHGLAVKRRNGI